VSHVGILLRRSMSTHAAEREQKETWPPIYSPSEPGFAVQASRPGTHAAENARSRVPSISCRASRDLRSGPRAHAGAAQHARRSSRARMQQSMHARERGGDAAWQGGDVAWRDRWPPKNLPQCHHARTRRARRRRAICRTLGIAHAQTFPLMWWDLRSAPGVLHRLPPLGPLGFNSPTIAQRHALP